MAMLGVSFVAAVLMFSSLALAEDRVGEDIGRSAEWTVAVKDPAEAEAQVRTALNRFGGFVSDRVVGDQVVLGLQVSSPSLDSFLEVVGNLGKVVRAENHAKDPTPAFATLNSRISALEASERDLWEQLSLLSPDEPLALDLQREVASVRSERFEALARRTLMEERVKYAPVRLILLPESALHPPSVWQEIARKFLLVWSDPIGAARDALVVGAGLLVPYLGGLALAAWAAIRLARRRRS